MGVQDRKKWITGQEFGEERRRLIAAGITHDSPEMKALFARVVERDDSLWEQFAGPLIAKYPGQWAAISLDGQAIIRTTSGQVVAAATEAFGGGNYVFGRLANFRGFEV